MTFHSLWSPMPPSKRRCRSPGSPLQAALVALVTTIQNPRALVSGVCMKQTGTPVLGGHWEGWMQQSHPNTGSGLFTPRPALSQRVQILPRRALDTRPAPGDARMLSRIRMLCPKASSLTWPRVWGMSHANGTCPHMDGGPGRHRGEGHPGTGAATPMQWDGAAGSRRDPGLSRRPRRARGRGRRAPRMQPAMHSPHCS